MPEIGFEIVTAERVVYSDEVDVVVAPGVEGQLAILPNHAPLMTMLQPGELMVRKAGEEESIFVSGGFLEVQGNKVIVLADTAERAEEIDTARADEARLRAEQRVAIPASEADHARAQAAVLRSLMRIKVAQKSRKRRPRG